MKELPNRRPKYPITIPVQMTPGTHRREPPNNRARASFRVCSGSEKSLHSNKLRMALKREGVRMSETSLQKVVIPPICQFFTSS